MKEHHLTWKEYARISDKDKHGKYIVKDYSVYYWKDGKIYREDGPAIVYNDGGQYWAINNKYHRLDGPAYLSSNGELRYYINDEYYSSKEEYEIAAYLYKNQLENYK